MIIPYLVIAILEYTPFLQFLILYVFLYYQDIGRFLHPRVKKERSALSDWYRVLADLKLVSLSLTQNDLRKLDQGLTMTRRQMLYYTLFITCALFSAVSDLLFFMLQLLNWYMVMIFQTGSAALLISAFGLSSLGSPAFYRRKHSTKLREERTSGSRTKHLSLEK